MKLSNKLTFVFSFIFLSSTFLNGISPKIKGAIDFVSKNVNVLAQKTSKITQQDIRDISAKGVEKLGNAINATNNFNEKSLNLSRKLEKNTFEFAKYIKEKATLPEIFVYVVATSSITYVTLKTLKGIYKKISKSKKKEN